MNSPLTSFNKGELSPKIAERIDIEAYQSGCKRLENFIPEKYGCITQRPGTYFVVDITNNP